MGIDADQVTYERRGAAAVATIDRRERRNAVDGPTADLLEAAFDRFESDDDARVLILAGAGEEAFCAGADLKAIDSLAPRLESPEGPLGFTRLTPSKPTIAAISGWCLAGGLELALWCDLRIAAAGARFGFTERRFGVPLIDGGTQRLPRIVGLGRALDIILTGRIFDADEALAIGMLTEVVPAGGHLARALAIAEALAAFPQQTMLADRRAAIDGLGLPLADGLALEAESGPSTFADARRGAARFAGGEGRGGARAGARTERGPPRPLECPAVSAPAIEVSDLRKSYGDVDAVRGLSFEVERGEVFGLLGPNGAGKTTTVEILEGYRKRSSGRVSVLGHDPERRERELRQRVGIVLQSCGFYPRLTVREAVGHMAKAYPKPLDADEAIALVGLEERANVRAGKLSGGQQRRLDLALALVGDPELVFLDEPTTGFDPAARRDAWEVVRRLRELDKTVLLTTHYLDEAQVLADRVAIVKDGVVVAEGPPSDLTPESGGYRVSYVSAGRRVEHRTEDPTDLLHRLTGDALGRGERLEGLEVARPTLEDVYLELTAEAADELQTAAGEESGR